MTGNVARKSRKKRSCCLPILLLLILAAAGIGGAFYWFYNNPISNDVVHDRVVRRLERISGLNVAYDSASLRLSTGQYTISNLRFLDPAQPEDPVLTVGEVLATIRPWQLVTNPESVLTKVILKNPSRLELVYTMDSIRLGERTQFLVDAVRKAQPPGSGTAGRLPFDELTIENAEVAFSEAEGILPDTNSADATMVMSGAITVANQAPSALAFQFDGQAAQPADVATNDHHTSPALASGVKATLVIDGTSKLHLSGNADHIELAKIFREMPQTTVHADGLSFDLVTDSSGAARSFKGDVKAAVLSYHSPEKGLVIQDEQMVLTADIDVNSSASAVLFRSLALESAGAVAGVQGNISYRETPQYDLQLQAQRISRGYRQFLVGLLPAGWNLEANRDSLAVNLDVSGGETVSSLNGTLALRGINLSTPALPAPLVNLNGDLVFGRDDVKLVGVTAVYAGAQVALDGTFTGDLWQKRAGDIAVNWSTALSVEEVIKYHGAQISGGATDVSGSGIMRGRGTWHQSVNLVNAGESGIPAVEGEIELEKVSFRHPLLPSPVAGLSGKALIDDNRLEVTNLAGEMQGSEMVIDGSMVGDRYFWRDPQVSGSLVSKLDLGNLGAYLSAQQQANVQKYQLAGRAETQMLVDGPLSDLGKKLTGVVKVQDVSFVPDLDFMRGTFTGVAGTLAWDGKVLQLQDVTGLLNDETVNLSGDISASKIDIRVNAEPALETVQATFPYMDKYLEMSGGAKVDLNYQAGGDGELQPGSLAEMLDAASALSEQSVDEKSFSLNGDIVFNDASMRHIAMPIARKENGREIPAGRVTKMNGTLRVSNDTLTVPESATITCSFADTPNCRLSGEIKIRPGHYPALKVKISSAGVFKMDTWALGWGKGLDKPDKPPITNRKADIDAEILAPAVVFRGQEAGRSRARVIFTMVQNENPRVTELRDVVIQGNQPGQGRIIGNARIESFVWSPQQFPRWQTSMDIQSMPLENMLAAVFVQPSNMRGMVTGNMEVQGISNDPRTVRGRGSSFMRNLEIGGTAVIQQLGQSTGRNFGGKLFQTAQAATFNIGNGALSSRDLALETNGLMLEMRGDYYFAADPSRGIPPKTIDGSLRLRLFKSVFGSIPLIGQVADLADEVTNAFLLAFRVTGTASAPRVSPIALPMFQGGA